MISLLRILMTACCIVCVIPKPVFARGARLADLSVTNSRGDLLISLKVEGAFSPKMKEAVFSGAPTTFSFFISLGRVRSFWADRGISEVTLDNTIKYNKLKKEFVVTRSWADQEPLIVRSFEEARKLMTEVSGFRLVPGERLEKGRRYQISAKAKLSKITLPLYLHYILIMASQWDFETEWYTIDFVY